MYCTNCGAQNPNGVKFCMNCGEPIVPPEPTAPVQTSAPAENRRVAFGALLLAALAIGPFLNAAISGIRNGIQSLSYPDSLVLLNMSGFFSGALLFVSALFLLLCLVRQLPEGKRPVFGGMALLFVSIACAYYVIGYLTAAGRFVFRWPTVAYLICYLACAVLFLIGAILAFRNKRFAVVGLIGAIVYLALHILILSNDVSSYLRRDVPDMLLIALPSILARLSYIFYAIALMIFSLKFRPAKE